MRPVFLGKFICKHKVDARWGPDRQGLQVLSARSWQACKTELHQGQGGGLGTACRVKRARRSCIGAKSEAQDPPAGPPIFAWAFCGVRPSFAVPAKRTKRSCCVLACQPEARDLFVEGSEHFLHVHLATKAAKCGLKACGGCKIGLVC